MEKGWASKRFKKSPNVVFRKVANEFVLVPIHKDAVDLEALFSFNETAARVWELIDGERTGGEIAQALAAEFGADPREVAKDAAELFLEMAELRFISE